ncbi:histidine kinase [Azoarcus sp. DD4]|uniref:sensor domain-containing diguanylate cyclase n=1 Tax=Azoarcus sp. DD4 TaxID=2027405 RepID=UPI00112C305B|nr:sensor domain-containing diguanylate cyclase [Azoarcus sp. DD4]QDF98057.1 histidine kinase [Azoarcus sp. DD4]
MIDISDNDFRQASSAVIAYLHKRFGFQLWMVTRTEGEDWIVLQVEDGGYGVSPGTVLRWADPFCAEMVKGNGPRIAPDSDAVPAYAAAPIGQQLPIKAYIGVPLTHADGSLFGTLCAIDPARQPDVIAQDLDLVELLARLLSLILQAELKAAAEVRRSERLQMEAQTDPMTGLANRRAWDRLLAKEEERCQRYGHPAAVLVVDLDRLKAVNDSAGHAAGDALIGRAASALRQSAREADVVARLGGDEFGILAVECDEAGAEALVARARSALAAGGIAASIGVAMRRPQQGLTGAWGSADRSMYLQKRSR